MLERETTMFPLLLRAASDLVCQFSMSHPRVNAGGGETLQRFREIANLASGPNDEKQKEQ
jgi:hypothetical protein